MCCCFQSWGRVSTRAREQRWARRSRGRKGWHRSAAQRAEHAGSAGQRGGEGGGARAAIVPGDELGCPVCWVLARCRGGRDVCVPRQSVCQRGAGARRGACRAQHPGWCWRAAHGARGWLAAAGRSSSAVHGRLRAARVGPTRAGALKWRYGSVSTLRWWRAARRDRAVLERREWQLCGVGLDGGDIVRGEVAGLCARRPSLAPDQGAPWKSRVEIVDIPLPGQPCLQVDQNSIYTHLRCKIE